MQNSIIQKAAAQYGTGEIQVESLGEGLIHRTYKVRFIPSNKIIVLQCINQHTFPQPENIIRNYREIYNYLQLLHPGRIFIPALLLTMHGKLFWIDETENFWRATEFIADSYSPAISKNEKEGFLAAKCFAQFTKQLSGLDTDLLTEIIPGFHDLGLRYRQFEDAVSKGHIKRLLRGTHLIAELRQRIKLVSFYEMMKSSPEFKLRVMHHDCKISNILFDTQIDQPICPVDLDTTMPGYYFSDVGDMIRTMACTVDENDTGWEKINVKKSLYQAIIKGYDEGIEDVFTETEKKYIHHAGLLMIYMQSLRFLTDYLNNDIYYQTSYPEQNLNRALNQFILLERLEEFVVKEYSYAI